MMPLAMTMSIIVKKMDTHEDLMRTNDVYRQLQLAAGV